MQYTLLEMVQDILSSMDGDEVSSVTDTTEAMQVVTVIKTVYNNMIANLELPIHYQIFNLTASGDNALPCIMYKPTTMESVSWVRYNARTDDDTFDVWTEIEFCDLPSFLEMTHQLKSDDSDVETMTITLNSQTFKFYCRNDGPPKYYTSFNDNTIVFDSFDNEIDTTLQSSKTMAFGPYVQTFTVSDVWVPNLRPGQFAYLFNEAKSLAWLELRQQVHPKAEKEARMQKIHQQKVKRAVIVDQSHPGPHYGRK